MKNILSVDFDFFVHENPDWDLGHSEVTQVFHQMAWQARYLTMDLYKECNPKTHADFRPNALIGNILRANMSFKKCVVVGVADSHKEAYRFVKAFGEECNVVNFDAHHDMFSECKELNCANWLSKLIEEKIVKTTLWVKPKWLRQYYKGDILFPGRLIREIYYEDLLKKKKEMQFDGVFFCRSGVWVPPHLDEQFVGMVQVFAKIITCFPKQYGQMYARTAPSESEAYRMYEHHQEVLSEFMSKTKSEFMSKIKSKLVGETA